MTSVFGMKIDLNMCKRSGIFRGAMQALAAAILAGLAADAAADSFSGLADPTQPAYTATAGAVAVAKPRGPQLQSTFISVSQRRAVISGKTYVVGDKFGGGIITDIQPYEVVMKKAERETRLRLLPKLAKETILVKVPAESIEGGKNEKQ